MADLVESLKQKFFDANGLPLAGGKLYSYQAGTTTPLVTYANQDESTENTNPIILDANGEADVWVGPNAYKFRLEDADGNLLWTVDNVSHLSPDSISNLMLQDRSVTTEKIALSGVETENVDDFAITRQKIANSAIDASKIDSTAKMHPDSVVTSSMTDLSVTTPKYADLSVTGPKIANQTIPNSKLAAANIVTSGAMPSNFFTTTSFSFVDVTNLSVTITTSGRPVKVFLKQSGSAQGIFSSQSTTQSRTWSQVKFLRGSTEILFEGLDLSASPTSFPSLYTAIPISCLQTIDTPAAGTHTYKVQIVSATTGTTAVLQGGLLVAMEI